MKIKVSGQGTPSGEIKEKHWMTISFRIPRLIAYLYWKIK